jgi:Flp pilus assembly pilin Flp
MLITYFRSLLAQLASDEKGQTAIEYALVIALISVVVVGVVAALFASNSTIMTDIAGKITGAL